MDNLWVCADDGRLDAELVRTSDDMILCLMVSIENGFGVWSDDSIIRGVLDGETNGVILGGNDGLFDKDTLGRTDGILLGVKLR